MFIFKSCQIYYHDVVFNNNAELVTGSVSVFNDSEGVSRLNATMLVKKEMKSLVINYEVRLRTISREYDFVFNKATIDFCNVARGVMGSMFIKYLKENSNENTTNCDFTCPFPAKTLYWRNFPIILPKYLPRGFGSKHDFEFVCNVKTKFNGTKKLVQFGSLKTTGTLSL